MIPFGDDQGGIRFVVSTIVLVGAMVAVYVYEWMLPPEELHQLVTNYGLRAQPVSPPDFLPFFAYPFLHSGPIHAVTSVLALWVFGSRLESRTSWWRFMLFFVACTVAGGIAQLQWGTHPDANHIGATVPVGSTALAYLILYWRARTRVLLLPLPLFVAVPASVSVLLFGVLQFHKVQNCFGLDCGLPLDYVPQAAAIVAGGLLLGPLLLGWPRRRNPRRSTAQPAKRAPRANKAPGANKSTGGSSKRTTLASRGR